MLSPRSQRAQRDPVIVIWQFLAALAASARGQIVIMLSPRSQRAQRDPVIVIWQFLAALAASAREQIVINPLAKIAEGAERPNHRHLALLGDLGGLGERTDCDQCSRRDRRETRITGVCQSSAVFAKEAEEDARKERSAPKIRQSLATLAASAREQIAANALAKSAESAEIAKGGSISRVSKFLASLAREQIAANALAKIAEGAERPNHRHLAVLGGLGGLGERTDCDQCSR